MTVGKQIVKVADLARLDLTGEERKRFGAEFEKIVAYFAQLQKLELEGEMLLGYPCPRIEDKPRDYDIKVEELTKHLKQGQFHIPPWLA
jgi:aspartyl/glutamyl-tRNA(Asn/Gln) amidotransferase C subunit